MKTLTESQKNKAKKDNDFALRMFAKPSTYKLKKKILTPLEEVEVLIALRDFNF